MILFITLLLGVGLAIIPLGRVYISLSRRKPGSKMHDKAYYNKFRAIVYIVSISMCLLSMLTLYLFGKYHGAW